MCIDQSDNELTCLEAIHLFVEILDHYFSNVCELDLVFNFHKVGARGAERGGGAGRQGVAVRVSVVGAGHGDHMRVCRCAAENSALQPRMGHAGQVPMG